MHDQGEHGGKIMVTINLHELGLYPLELLGYSDISSVKDFEGLSLKQIRDILSDYSCILEFDIDDIPLRARSILYLLELSKKNNSEHITNVTANI